MAILRSGLTSINSLLDSYNWQGVAGKALNITYSFATSAGNTVASNLQGAYLSAANSWANVANIKFIPGVVGKTQITFSQHDLAYGGAGVIGETSQWVYPSTGKYAFAEVTLDDRFNTPASVASGTLGYLTLIHEIGHALGLKHPGNYNGENGSGSGTFLPTNEDTLNASVMSYNNSAIVTQTGRPPITPQLYDIQAVQFLYGANTAYNSGNTTYTISGTSTAQTIWDGGGIDTLDGSRVNTNSTINLNEGLTQYSQIGNSFVWAAFGAKIENATGGGGNDTIIGNALNNVLTGGAGNDNLSGAAGNDTLIGGIGNDTLNGGSGSDILNGGTGADIFYFTAGSGRDVIQGFEGAGIAGGDVIRLAALNMNGTAYASLDALVKAVTYTASGAVVNLGASHDITLVGISKLTAGDFLVG